MRMKLLVIALIPFLLCGCRPMIETQDIIFGTSVSITANKGDVKGCIELAREIESLMSVNIENSDISRINNASGKRGVTVDRRVAELIEDSLYYSQLSNGEFDVTVLPLVKLWGIGTTNPRCPSQQELGEAIKLCGSEGIAINGEIVKLTKKGAGIDLGGIAKGYSADCMATHLIESGCTKGIINLGGNIRVIGRKNKKDLWQIGIQDPDGETGEYMGYVTVEDCSISTSGDYQRYFIKKGKRYHHIIDPKTGYPAQTDLRSVTVITDNSQKADALSTVAFMSGSEKALALLEEGNNTEGILLTKNGEVLLTSNAKSLFTLTNTEKYGIFAKKR